MGDRSISLRLAGAIVAIGLGVSGAPAMAEVMDNQINMMFKVDQLEYRFGEHEEFIVWDAQGWIGTDYNKVALKTEGEKVVGGATESVEGQILYQRLISKFFDAQVGIRHDFRPGPTRTYGVFGVQGLAPQWFEVDANAFVSERGDISFRLEVEYDLLLTQRLILQPVIEVEAALSQDEAIGQGDGLRSLEMGLRLRYEVTREFAPYIGVNWEKSFGDSADFKREEGEGTASSSVVLGVTFWF
ncbi:MAG: copper resistance protein B [Alphaproteobacteria bacterium]|nr:copper resistance protein B [Alphaproteobacteria bacterium]